MVENSQEQVHQIEVEVEVGDVIVTKCPSGVCSLFGRNNHEYVVLEIDAVMGHKLGSAKGFLPIEDEFLVSQGKLWGTGGCQEILEIKKGAGVENVARYQEYLANIVWANENGLTDERFSDLWDAEELSIRMVIALMGSNDISTNTSNAAIVLKLMGIEANERQKMLLGVALSALIRPYQDELSRREAKDIVSSLFGSGMSVAGPFPGDMFGSLGDLLGKGYRFRSEPDETAADDTGTTEGSTPPSTEEAEAS